MHAGGRRYVSFGVVVAQGVTCCLKPEVAVERDGRLSREALELPAQRALGHTGSGGDFASSERSGKVALHEADGHRNASRGRTAGPEQLIRGSGRLLHPVFPRCRSSAPRLVSYFGPPSNIAAGLDPELVVCSVSLHASVHLVDTVVQRRMTLKVAIRHHRMAARPPVNMPKRTFRFRLASALSARSDVSTSPPGSGPAESHPTRSFVGDSARDRSRSEAALGLPM